MQVPGRPFHGEFSSGDASSLTEEDSRFKLYGASNTPNLIALAANDRVVITDVQISAEEPIHATIYDGPDTTVDDGETVFHVAFLEIIRTWMLAFTTPHYCQRNDDTITPRGYPKLKTNASGQIQANIRGIIFSDAQ